jgi:ribulose-phosphate 3-epimerase
MVEILPAILEPDFVGFERQIRKVFGLVDRVQVDIIDESFGAPTMKPSEVLKIDSIIEYDFHLMVKEPIEWLGTVPVGDGTYVYGHVERMSSVSDFLGEAEAIGLGAGLAIDIDTPVDAIKDFVFDLDGICLLSVKAGKQGQEFDPRVLKKIEQVRAMRHDLRIVVDGGLDVTNIKKCIAAEWAIEMAKDEFERDFLNIAFAVGGHLLKAENVKDELYKLQNLQED